MLLAAVDPLQRVYTVKGDFDLGSFNEVALRVLCGGVQRVVVIFKRGEREIARTLSVDLIPLAEPQEVILPRIWPPPAVSKCDSISLVFDGDETFVGLMSVALVAHPPTSFAPADGKPQFIVRQKPGRGLTGQWLVSGNPMAAVVKLGQQPSLVFSFLQPAVVRRVGVAPRLEVSIEGDEGSNLDRSFELESKVEQLSERHDVVIELDEIEGDVARVCFTLSGAPDVDGVACVIQDAWIVDRSATPPPSILLVTSDTHRADHLGIAGMGVDIETPTLDALARRGIFFSDCFSSTNTTNPSHIAIMTGVSPRDTGIVDQVTALSDVAPTLAEAFRAAGYSTWASISARHLGPQVSGLGQGFDRVSWPAESFDRRADATIADVMDWMPTADGRPVFLWLHVFDAHYPYAPPPAYDRRYYPKGKDPFSPSSPRIPLSKILSTNPATRELRDLEYMRSQYRSEISYLDDQLRAVLDLPRFRDGVIALVADHGESLGHNNVQFDHTELNYPTLHVPLILVYPGVTPGVRGEAPVVSTDVGRTLLDLAGLRNAQFPGRNLCETIGVPFEAKARFAVAANRSEASITIGDRHLTLQLDTHAEEALMSPRTKHGVELFDVSKDPECGHDILDSELDTAKRMRASLIEWLTQRRSLGWAGLRAHDAELLRGLQQLGYTANATASGVPLWIADNCERCQKFR